MVNAESTISYLYADDSSPCILKAGDTENVAKYTQAMPLKDIRKKSKGCWPSLMSKKHQKTHSKPDVSLPYRTSNHVNFEKADPKPRFKIADRLLSMTKGRKNRTHNLPSDDQHVISVDCSTMTHVYGVTSHPYLESGNDINPDRLNSSSATRGNISQGTWTQVANANGANDHEAKYAQLSAAVELCDRRIERLYGRLIWLRNSGDVTPHAPYTSLATCRSLSQTESICHSEKPKLPADFQEPLLAVEHQISCISLRLNQLKNRVESHDFLSWLGLTREIPTSKLASTGRSCPPPNPQLHLIRRSDAAAQVVIDEYICLCGTSVPEKTRMSLRESTFNNWPWSDAWLIRFVRQMFFDLDLVTHFDLSVVRLDIWLCDVYRRYNRVPFHNYKHAFMVTQMAYAILWSAKLKDCLTLEDQLILLISTICHDLDHPGFNNAYQINAGTELAVRYNDQSPLENHHSATAFDILSRTEANLLDHLDRDTFRRIREGIIRCILATDMSRHNDILSKFNEVVLNDFESSQAIDEKTQKPNWCADKSKLDLFMMILIKLCDISNEARPLKVSEQWIDRLLAEFFNQSDYEKLVGLPVAPFMDRDNVTKAASQCGFIRFVLLPLYQAVAKLIPELEDVIVKPVIVQLDYYTTMQRENEKSESVSSESPSTKSQEANDEQV